MLISSLEIIFFDAHKNQGYEIIKAQNLISIKTLKYSLNIKFFILQASKTN